jgi:TRAP-type uncharacterized transport system substrate-binding protein
MKLTRHILIFIAGLIIYFIINIYVRSIHLLEHFQQIYHSQVVQLKKEVTNPLTIAVGNNDTYTSKLMNIYSNKFPMIIYNNSGATYNSLKEFERGKCNFAITQLDLAESLYKGDDPFNNSNKDIRIVSGLNNVSLILMARSNFSIKNIINTNNLYLTLGDLQKYISITSNTATICIDMSDESTYYMLMNILHLYKFDMTKLNIIRGNVFETNNVNEITNDFQSGNIDIIAATIIHPDDRIRKFYQSFPCRFIGIENIDMDNIHVKSPNYIRDSINLEDYEVTSDQVRMLEVFSCPLSIITTQETDNDTVYRYINGLFENIEYLHENYKQGELKSYKKNNSSEVLDGFLTEQDYYKIQGYKNTSGRQIDSLTPSSFYNIKSMIPIHEGTRKYLMKIGLITYNDSDLCKNYLPDGDPRKMQNLVVNCNSMPELVDGRHYGHGIF